MGISRQLTNHYPVIHHFYPTPRIYGNKKKEIDANFRLEIFLFVNYCNLTFFQMLVYCEREIKEINTAKQGDHTHFLISFLSLRPIFDTL